MGIRDTHTAGHSDRRNHDNLYFPWISNGKEQEDAEQESKIKREERKQENRSMSFVETLDDDVIDSLRSNAAQPLRLLLFRYWSLRFWHVLSAVSECDAKWVRMLGPRARRSVSPNNGHNARCARVYEYATRKASQTRWSKG